MEFKQSFIIFSWSNARFIFFKSFFVKIFISHASSAAFISFILPFAV